MTAATKRIDHIITRLRNLQDSNGVDLPQLERIIQNFEQLQHSARSVQIGFFGPSGSGKSTLMNRILGVEILPASDGGESCTNTIIKISPKAEQGEQFEVIVDYFDNGELTEMLQFKAPVATAAATEEETEDDRMAEEILEALWADEDIPINPKKALDLIPTELRHVVGRRVFKTFSTPFQVKGYLETVNVEKKLPYLIKHIEVRGYFEALDEQICLLDIPGSGSTMFLNNLQRQGLDQSDLVVFVEKQARVRNADGMKRLEKHSDRFERKVGFALCMTGAGDGLEDALKQEEEGKDPKRLRTDGVAEPDLGDEYVANQKQLFKANLESVGKGALSRKLAGMEIFMLENKGKEPEFSKVERAKFNRFLRRIAKSDVSSKIVDGNVDAVAADAKSRLNPPSDIELDLETMQEIQRILNGSNQQEPDFFKHGEVPPLDFSNFKAATHYRNTLKGVPLAPVNYHPSIPIWSHIVSSLVDAAQVTASLKYFETNLEQVNNRLEPILGVLLAHFKRDEAKANVCYYRIKSLVFGSVIADLEHSTKLMKGSLLENAVADKFWPQIPVATTGKGNVKKNQNGILAFISSIADEARELLEARMQEEFYTLDKALRRASAVVADPSNWLPVDMDQGNATTRSAGDAESVLWVLLLLTWDDPNLVLAAMRKLEFGAENATEGAQVWALRVLNNLAVNNGEYAREMFVTNSTLVPLLVSKVESNSEQVQAEALSVLESLAFNVDNAREMVTMNPTLVPLLVAKVDSNSEEVQLAALRVLRNLAQNWNSGIKQKMATLLAAKLGTDNPEQVQVALSVLQSLANNNKNTRDMVIKHAALVPLLMTMLAFATALASTTTGAAPLMFPVFPQVLVDASAELDVVLKFRLLVDKVNVFTRRVLDKDAFMDHNCGDRSVLECFQVLESMKLDLTLLEAQLGSEPFFAPPTPQQQDWIAKRNLVRSNLLSSTTRLNQAISATKVAHLTEFNALKRQLGVAIDKLELFVQQTNSPGLFSSDSVCDEASKSIRIEAGQRELLHVFQVELVQGMNSASPRPAIDKVTKCYLELILLCKMRTREELDVMLRQARDVLQSPGVLSWTEKRLENNNDFISQNEELQAKLERANQIITKTTQLRNQFLDLEIAIAEHGLLQMKALRTGQDAAAIEGEMVILDATRKSILSIKGELDKEMRHLASKPMASEENVVCHFPELFYCVTQTWEAKPVGQALSKADEIKALLLKSDLLLTQGVAEYAGPTERMQLTMKSVQPHLVKGAVANGSGAQVVIKRVAINDSLTEIAKTKRILRASRIAAHPSILSCLGGIVVSEREVNLVFPYMSGGDLAFWSQEHVRSVSRKLDVLTQVSDAIVALHRIDIFHRDIKPWNIVMDSSQDDAVPKLTDFEMSKETGIAQTFNTTRGLLGTTQGFRAPEVGKRVTFSATDYGKQDVYSFGATAMWLLEDEPAHSALFTSCKNDDANLRPSSKEVYDRLSKRPCIVCLDDDKAFKDCVVCPDGAHCICKGCFDGWVKDQLQTELGRRKEIVACPSCTTNTPFPIRLYAHHIDLVLRSHKEKVESTVRQQVNTEMAAALERERGLGVVALALRKIEDLLTSKCPQCKAAFADFTNCCALTCASCNIGFCAFCHQGASADAHSHVAHCTENPNRGEPYCDEAVYATQQKAFKTKLLEAFLETLDEVTQDHVRESAVGREYLPQKRVRRA